MTQLLTMVEEQVDAGEFDDLGDILGDLNGRPQDLFWKEDSDGVLYVAADRRRPETIGRVALDGGSLTAEEVGPADVDWDRLSTLSEPDSAIRDRQFD